MANYYSHIFDHPELDWGDIALIKKLRPRTKSVLDLGCGEGKFLVRAEKEFTRVFGIDKNRKAILRCRKMGLKVVLGEAEKLPFKKGEFDVVRARELLEHLEEPLAVVKEGRRVLKKKGLFLVHLPTVYSTFYPLGNFWDDYTHIRPFSRLGVRRLLEDGGFVVLEIKGYTLGRNGAERFWGGFLARVLPHTWRAVGEKIKN